MKEKKGDERQRERDKKRGGGREGDEGQWNKGEGSYQQVFNDQLRKPK